MAKGRKRKAGKRTKSGRLTRAGQVRYDQGSDHTKAMQALYGQDGCDAIGRAFQCGLLGKGSEAKAMLDMARKISNAYWHAYSQGSYNCPLADRSSGSIASIPAEVALRREKWLNQCLTTLEAHIGADRRYFDQLVIDVNPDCGPLWLDRLCAVSRLDGEQFDIADVSSLRKALKGLAILAGVDVPVIRKKAA